MMPSIGYRYMLCTECAFAILHYAMNLVVLSRIAWILLYMPFSSGNVFMKLVSMQ